MKLYYVEYFDGFQNNSEYMWGHSYGHIEEVIMTRSSINEISSIEFIEYKNKIIQSEE